MFLYFLPTRLKTFKGPQGMVALFEQAGAAHALCPGLDTPHSPTDKGPGDQPGLVVMPHLKGAFGSDPTPKVLYDPGSQTWRKSPAGSFWIATRNGHPLPTPDQLRRDRIIDGHDVEMLDGSKWMIPVARAFPSGTRFPQRLKLSADGKVWEYHELDQYIPICRSAEKIVEVFKGYAKPRDEEADDELADTPESEGGLDEQAAMSIVCDAIAINYRVSPVEIDLLGIIGTDQLGEVCRALIDFPTYLHMIRDRSKNAPAPASLPTDSGSPGDLTTTPPPSPT